MAQYLKVNDYIVDNSGGGATLEGQTTLGADSVYFECQVNGINCLVGRNLTIQLAVGDSILPQGFHFTNQGSRNYFPIRYSVPIGGKLLVVENKRDSRA